jgi:membrane-anchored protein YejM (alkaline phosphatase superfamily)
MHLRVRGGEGKRGEWSEVLFLFSIYLFSPGFAEANVSGSVVIYAIVSFVLFVCCFVFVCCYVKRRKQKVKVHSAGKNVADAIIPYASISIIHTSSFLFYLFICLFIYSFIFFFFICC